MPSLASVLDDSPEERLRDAMRRDVAGDGPGARAALSQLIEQRPGWFEPLLRLAQSLRTAGESAAAANVYEKALELDPAQPDALLGLAALLMAAGQQLPRAQLLVLRCCGIEPDRAEAWDALGVSLILTNDPSAAESAFAEAQRLAPDMIDYALHRVEAAIAAGREPAEWARLAAAVENDPLDVASMTAWGFLLDQRGDREAAADILETVTALRPDALPALLLLGRILGDLHRPAQAEVVLARAIALEPENPLSRNARAVMLLRLQRAAEARTILLDLVEEDGSQATFLCNLANAHTALGEQSAAVRAAEAAIALAPDASVPRRILCNALPYTEGIGGADLLEALQAAAHRLPRATSRVWRNLPDPDRRLRVGLLSGSLKAHPVGWLTVAGFEALGSDRFELIGLAQHTAEDHLARRFRSIARVWENVAALNDTALAEKARALEVDILVDLGGYGEAGRMPACSQRLAPVQVKWVGAQNHSSGLPEMDWFVTDRWETPPGFERFYSERLLRLPDGYVCYSPPADAPDVGTLPMLENRYVTFGCFNNLAKVTPSVIAVWSRLLRIMPTARLVLKSHACGDPPTRDRLHAAFAANGVDPERIELQGAARHRRLLAEYGRIDVVLDPFPYSGGLTTCEALWMGVPVVTLPGETFASRHSTSHLCNIGLDEWVAADVESYVALAVQKAAAPAELSVLRQGLRERLRTSPLCDGPRFGRGLGEALRSAWQEWCGEPR